MSRAVFSEIISKISPGWSCFIVVGYLVAVVTGDKLLRAVNLSSNTRRNVDSFKLGRAPSCHVILSSQKYVMPLKASLTKTADTECCWRRFKEGRKGICSCFGEVSCVA